MEEKEVQWDQANLESGLSNQQVIDSKNQYGENILSRKKKKPWILKFLMQFKDTLIIILLIAAVVSLIIDIHEWVESLIIFIVVILNAILGVVQEDKAEKSLEALEKISSPYSKVIRNGELVKIESKDIVVGDILVFEAGDYIPCDGILFDSSHLKIDESTLTGESVPVEKNGLSRKEYVFSSTYVVNGRGKALVTKIGMETEVGKIAKILLEEKKEMTPLQHKLDQVGKIIGILAIIVCVIVFALEAISLRGTDNYLLSAFKSAIALAVAAIPEGLATVVTIVLAIGVSNMAKQNAIVKKLPAVETLGCTSIICSDKTGTLTQNKMTVTHFATLNGIKEANKLTEENHQLIAYFANCVDAKISIEDGNEVRIGDPTELALIDVENKYYEQRIVLNRVADLPFDSERKMMSILIKDDKGYLLITKGAPDNIVDRSTLVKKDKEKILKYNDEMADTALRVLGLGIRRFDTLVDLDESLENELEFVGLVGMIDPPREEVKSAIAVAKNAGIKTIMITGDHLNTAVAIAKELGIMNDEDKAISSSELNEMADETLKQRIENIRVYARVSPEDKVRIVKAWQNKGHVVSMTGDGVNDSPSLKVSDIGCAMGITGTDVSKEAADMILMDDNYATIVKAVKEGRGIYQNIKKCVKYLLSSNIGEVITIFLASLISVFGFNLGVPLAPLHLLWINLITDSLPAFGLGMEKAEDKVMNEKPRPKNEGFFAHKLGYKIAFEGVIIGLLTLTSYIIGNQIDHTVGQTMAFLTLSTTQLLHAFNTKSDHTLFSKKTFNNRFLNLAVLVGLLMQFIVIYVPFVNTQIFGLVALDLSELLISLGLSFIIVVAMEVSKLLKLF